MTEEKRNRIAAAVTLNAILLIVILAAVVIYQLVIIGGVARERARILSEIADLEQKIESGQADLDFLQSERHLRDLAIQYGYRFPENT